MARKLKGNGLLVGVILIVLLGVLAITQNIAPFQSIVITADEIEIPDSGGMKIKITGEIRQLGEATKLKPLTITPQDITLEPGETKTFTEAMEMFISDNPSQAYCSTLEMFWKVKKSIITVDSGEVDYGSAYPSSVFAFFEVTAGGVGSYTIETNWRCNGIVLGIDGKFGGTASPFTTRFDVSGEPDPDPIDPPTGKTRCWFYNGLTEECQSINIEGEDLDCKNDVSSAYYNTESECIADIDIPPPIIPPQLPIDIKTILIISGGIVLVIIGFLSRRK